MGTRALDTARLMAGLREQTAVFAGLVDGRDPHARVPTCPDWELRDLVGHIGQAHRRAAELVKSRTRETPQIPFTAAMDDPERWSPWLLEGAETLIEAVRDAGADVIVWTFMGPRPPAFWVRRMLHDTSVHQADAAATAHCSTTGWSTPPSDRSGGSAAGPAGGRGVPKRGRLRHCPSGDRQGGSTGMSTVPEAPVTGDGWRTVWSPVPRRDGLDAFASVEEDRAGSRPGAQHIKALGTMYRFDIHHPEDVDTYPDRQRQEVKGMRVGGRDRRVAEGETWRFSWSWYLSGRLRATTSFTHVHQLFASGPGGGPMLMISVRRRHGRDTLELNAAHSGVIVGAADLGPLRGRWIGVELEAGFATAPAGRVRWRVTTGDATAVDVERGGLGTWLGTQGISPKWGIYRSLKDEARLTDAHLLLRDLRASLRC